MTRKAQFNLKQWQARSKDFISAYKRGSSQRNWVLREPVGALFKALVALVELQENNGNQEVMRECKSATSEWGPNGELVIQPRQIGPSTDRWVSPALGLHFAMTFSKLIDSIVQFDPLHFESLLTEEIMDRLEKIKLFGRDPDQITSPASWDTVEPAAFSEIRFGRFTINSLIFSDNATFVVSHSNNNWILDLKNWVEWLEFNQVVQQVLSGSIESKAGRFSLRSPATIFGVTIGFSLDVPGVRITLQDEEFHELADALRQTLQQKSMRSVNERFSNFHGEI